MALNINASLFLYTEKDIATELAAGGLATGRVRNFISSYASLLKTQTQLPVAVDEITVRIDGIDLRLDGIDSRLDGIDSRLDAVDFRIDDVEAVAYMAMMT